MYSAINSSAYYFARAFFDEAQRTWLIQQNHHPPDQLTTVMSLQLLSLSCLCGGRNQQGLMFLSQGLRMAQRLKLVPGVDDSAPKTQNVASGDEYRAQAHSAWGTFIWLM